MDKLVADFRREFENYEQAILSFSQLASYTPVTERTFRGWSPERILSRKYDSVQYERYQGFIVDWKDYIEERKKEREKKAEDNEK